MSSNLKYCNLLKINQLYYVFKPILSILLLWLVACQKNSESKNTEMPKELVENDTFSIPGLIRRKNTEDIKLSQINLDSLQSAKLFESAFKMILDKPMQKGFKIENDTTKIIFGNLFSPFVQHLFIKRIKFKTITEIRIFKFEKSRFIKQLEEESLGAPVLNDTIFDVNGDNYLDFALNWYGMNGCCLKNFYSVYLFRIDSAKFTKEIHFTNPTFSPQEKTVRGVFYGYPSQVPLYKYRWQGYELELVELIYPEPMNHQIFYRKKSENAKEKGEVLSMIPPEYHHIYGIDWFISYTKK
jgi:hypothetical protein